MLIGNERNYLFSAEPKKQIICIVIIKYVIKLLEGYRPFELPDK